MTENMERIRHPEKDDLCPCGTGDTFQRCQGNPIDDVHTPDALEYAHLVGKYYPDSPFVGLPKEVAIRMRELEKLLNLKTLVEPKDLI